MGLIEVEDIPYFHGNFETIRQYAGQLRTVGGNLTSLGTAVATKYRGLYDVYQAPERDLLITSIDPVERDTADFGGNTTKLGDLLKGFAEELEPVNKQLGDVIDRVNDFKYELSRLKWNGQAIQRAVNRAKKAAGGLPGIAIGAIDVIGKEIVGPMADLATTGKVRHEAYQYKSADFPDAGMHGDGAIIAGTTWDSYSDLVHTNNSLNADVRRLAEPFGEIQIRYANRIADL